ncbi:MAG: hypothetical protein HQL60_01815 [Magnetococcales bacterium]|nr:hypothetical protein [Magnetococcales bacterium]
MNNEQILEIAAWRFVTELVRRFPDRFRIIRTHPGGGQYDCLDLVDYQSQPKMVLSINIEGSIHVHDLTPSNQGRWSKLVFEKHPRAVLDHLCKVIQVEPPKQSPPSTPAVISYRFIATFLSHAAFGLKKRWQCVNGYLDSSGMCGGPRDEWFKQFPQTTSYRQNKLPNDVLGQPEYRFWFLVEDGKPRLCLEDSGTLFREDGSIVDIAKLYLQQSLPRRIWPLIIQTAADLLP